MREWVSKNSPGFLRKSEFTRYIQYCLMFLLKLPEIVTFNVLANSVYTGQHVLEIHRVCSVFLFQTTRILHYSEFYL